MRKLRGEGEEDRQRAARRISNREICDERARCLPNCVKRVCVTNGNVRVSTEIEKKRENLTIVVCRSGGTLVFVTRSEEHVAYICSDWLVSNST